MRERPKAIKLQLEYPFCMIERLNTTTEAHWLKCTLANISRLCHSTPKKFVPECLSHGPSYRGHVTRSTAPRPSGGTQWLKREAGKNFYCYRLGVNLSTNPVSRTRRPIQIIRRTTDRVLSAPTIGR